MRASFGGGWPSTGLMGSPPPLTCRQGPLQAEQKAEEGQHPGPGQHGQILGRSAC